MSDPPSDAAMRRLRVIIGIALGSLTALCVAAAVLEFWPTPWIDELGFRWFGHSSWRLRIAGAFAIYGAGLLVLLLLALIAKSIARKR